MGYPTRTAGQAAPNRVAQDERAAALVGDRGRQAQELKAVLHGDAAAAGLIKLQANFVTGAPTAADYNALLTDLRAVAAVLNRMGANIAGL